jgi:hypothetical protein
LAQTPTSRIKVVDLYVSPTVLSEGHGVEFVISDMVHKLVESKVDVTGAEVMWLRLSVAPLDKGQIDIMIGEKE